MHHMQTAAFTSLPVARHVELWSKLLSVTKQQPQAAQTSPALFRSKSIAIATYQRHAIPLALPVVAWHGRLGRAELEPQVSCDQRGTCICAETRRRLS